jgi:hypothetical protein
MIERLLILGCSATRSSRSRENRLKSGLDRDAHQKSDAYYLWVFLSDALKSGKATEPLDSARISGNEVLMREKLQGYERSVRLMRCIIA